MQIRLYMILHLKLECIIMILLIFIIYYNALLYFIYNKYIMT